MRVIAKPYILIPILIIALIASMFIIWMFLPVKSLDIAILNKNVPANLIDKFNNLAGDYRKHMGFFWVLGNQRYINPHTKEFYDYKSDYYGPIINEASSVVGEKKLIDMENTPDLLYLTDGYGDMSNP
ncbi:MAG TPA: hypothetical protein PLZ84_08475, partial [Clostridia bacterium]|nr:hypothetical protein [Clostridia bacterium]